MTMHQFIEPWEWRASIYLYFLLRNHAAYTWVPPWQFLKSCTCMSTCVLSPQAASGALTTALVLTASLSDDGRAVERSLLIEQTKSLAESLQTLLSTLRYIHVYTLYIYVHVGTCKQLNHREKYSNIIHVQYWTCAKYEYLTIIFKVSVFRATGICQPNPT